MNEWGWGWVREHEKSVRTISLVAIQSECVCVWFMRVWRFGNNTTSIISSLMHACIRVQEHKKKMSKTVFIFSFSIWTVECSSLQKCYAKPPVRGNGKKPLQIILFFNSLTYSPQFSFNQYLCLPMVNTKPNKTPTNHQLDVTIMHSDEANEQKKNTSEHHSFA